MEIVLLEFEKPLVLSIRGEKVNIFSFKLPDGEIRFGINAPKTLSVNREEIYIAKQKKLNAQARLQSVAQTHFLNGAPI